MADPLLNSCTQCPHVHLETFTKDLSFYLFSGTRLLGKLLTSGEIETEFNNCKASANSMSPLVALSIVLMGS